MSKQLILVPSQSLNSTRSLLTLRFEFPLTLHLSRIATLHDPLRNELNFYFYRAEWIAPSAKARWKIAPEVSSEVSRRVEEWRAGRVRFELKYFEEKARRTKVNSLHSALKMNRTMKAPGASTKRARTPASFDCEEIAASMSETKQLRVAIDVSKPDSTHPSSNGEKDTIEQREKRHLDAALKSSSETAKHPPPRHRDSWWPSSTSRSERRSERKKEESRSTIDRKVGRKPRRLISE